MKLLIDTHVFLWYLTANAKLPDKFKRQIQTQPDDIFLSAASIWESVIKHGLGKLPLPGPPATWLPRQREAHGIAPLAIDEGALSFLAALPPIHRDPFDRLLIAQAMQFDLTIVTVDPVFSNYPARILTPV